MMIYSVLRVLHWDFQIFWHINESIAKLLKYVKGNASPCTAWVWSKFPQILSFCRNYPRFSKFFLKDVHKFNQNFLQIFLRFFSRLLTSFTKISASFIQNFSNPKYAPIIFKFLWNFCLSLLNFFQTCQKFSKSFLKNSALFLKFK